MRILTLLFVTLFLAGCGADRTPILQQQAFDSWDNLQLMYQDRAQLIPTVMTIVSQQVPGEQTLFEDVDRARRNAVEFNASHETTMDKDAILKFQVVQMQLSQAVKWLSELPNTYTILKANNNYQAAVLDLTNASQRAEQGVKQYNNAVAVYNQELESGSGKMMRKILHKQQRRMEPLPE